MFLCVMSVPEVNQKKSIYFVSPLVDFVFIGGLSILAYFFFMFFYKPEYASGVATLSTSLLLVGNWPHFAATNYRLYHDKNNMKQFPLTSYLLPFLILALVVSALCSLDEIAPALALLFLLWSPYHFCGQSVGITIVYAMRSGFHFTKIEKGLLELWMFGIYLYTITRGHTSTAGGDYLGIKYPGLGLPLWLPDIFFWVMVFGAVGFIFCFIQKSIENKKVLPLIILLPPIAQYLWFVPLSYVPNYNSLVPFFHSFQYMLIAWGMHLAERAQIQSQNKSSINVFKETGIWYVGVVFIGYMLFQGFPRLISMFFGLPVNMTEGVFIAGVQLHHFIVDGVIWKLRHKFVSSPLMIHVPNLMKAKA
jgi:hypothetical protein